MKGPFYGNCHALNYVMIYLVENDYYSAYVVSYDIVLFCPLKAFMPGDNKTVELGDDVPQYVRN